MIAIFFCALFAILLAAVVGANLVDVNSSIDALTFKNNQLNNKITALEAESTKMFNYLHGMIADALYNEENLSSEEEVVQLMKPTNSAEISSLENFAGALKEYCQKIKTDDSEPIVDPDLALTSEQVEKIDEAIQEIASITLE